VQIREKIDLDECVTKKCDDEFLVIEKVTNVIVSVTENVITNILDDEMMKVCDKMCDDKFVDEMKSENV
jgi:hypothetical protein